MTRGDGYDEVMIVNPVDPDRGLNEGVTLMNFHAGQPPEMGGYAGWPAGYGGTGADPVFDGAYGYAEADPYSGYAEAPELVGWGDPYAYGYGAYAPGYAEAEPPVGYYADESPMGDYAESDPYAGYYGYGEVDPYAGYGYGYGYTPPGLGIVHMPYPPRRPRGGTPGVGESYIDPSLQGPYAEPDMSGYVRDAAPAFNAGCPMPTNVAGYEEAPELEGYVPPRDVSPTCGNLTPGPAPAGPEPETFRPLW